ncbi:hypothetical protein SAMN05660865_00876 [Caloramator fervidus]|uniref:Uncharacterized protein n=1 Tax=Caloramator fervidus TaxID=29344 RepID=A0A1H5UF84_9CLOT|nr:hypothetical protein [Caloramator fervidus]SEF73649.1 hypothetical protein SAMN05660865_00876 [Caloramator fervidus]
MCYFIFARTKNKLPDEVLRQNEVDNLYVTDITEKVEIDDGFLYHISNGHCACDIVISSFSRIDNVKNILQNIEKDFKFIVVNSDEEDVEVLLGNKQDFDEFLNSFPKKEIPLNELLEIYPNFLEFDTLYIVKQK